MYAREPSRRAARGFTLIELMVGLLVALAVGLAATAAAVGYAAQERQGVGTGVAVAGAANALAAIKHDIGLAGLGFFGDTGYACRTLAVSAAARDLSQQSFAPLEGSAGANSDTLQLVAASDVAAGAAVTARSITGLQSATLDSYLPAAAGQAVLLAPAPGSAGSACTVRSISAVETAPATGLQTLRFDAGGAHNGVAFASAPSYAAGDRVTLLGTIGWSRYVVQGDRLMLEQPLRGTPAATLVSGVVAFRVLYGVSTAGSAAVAEWSAPQGDWAAITPDNIGRVRAVRLGLVTRSAHPEKPGKDGHCRASDAAPVLFGRAVTLPADWQCYRYRSDEVTVPLRNVVMGMQ